MGGVFAPDDKDQALNEPLDSPHHAIPTVKLTLGRRLMNYFLTGLVIAGPIGITLYIAWWIIRFIDDMVTPFVPRAMNPSTYLPFEIPGFGLVVAFLTIGLVGFFAANLFGRTLVKFGEAILHRLPMISTLYKALKQIFETVVNQSAKSFREVGLIQYPRPGLWAVVFISTEAKGEMAEKVDGEQIMSVFLPTTPNPTSGFLLYVPRSEIVILDMSIEDAAKLIVSAGLVSPDYRQKTESLAEKPVVPEAETAG
ncbi:MAG: DUF502 domain-containing protein [Alphaproteobacteria bacterium]|nr:DUF502 domain-containing protein [Alphaproteobacteria bacterium]